MYRLAVGRMESCKQLVKPGARIEARGDGVLLARVAHLD